MYQILCNISFRNCAVASCLIDKMADMLDFHHYTTYNAKTLTDAQIMAQNEIQYSGHRHLEFISDGLATFIHTSHLALQTSTSVQNFTPILSTTEL